MSTRVVHPRKGSLEKDTSKIRASSARRATEKKRESPRKPRTPKPARKKKGSAAQPPAQLLAKPVEEHVLDVDESGRADSFALPFVRGSLESAVSRPSHEMVTQLLVPTSRPSSVGDAWSSPSQTSYSHSGSGSSEMLFRPQRGYSSEEESLVVDALDLNARYAQDLDKLPSSPSRLTPKQTALSTTRYSGATIYYADWDGFQSGFVKHAVMSLNGVASAPPPVVSHRSPLPSYRTTPLKSYRGF
jgi:hypothetical protein